MAAGDVVITRDFVIPLGPGGGRPRVVMGTVTLDGGNPTPIELGGMLSSIDGAVVSIEGAGAPGADPTAVTSLINGTSVDVYAWKPTTGGAAGNPDLIASTNNARLVSFIAVGPDKK